MELWKRKIILSLFHYSGKRRRIEYAFMAKHPHVPDRLYKYRQFTKYHIDALKKDVLWMSSPDRFNDPYEAAVYFDPDRFLVEDQSVEDFMMAAEETDSIVNAGGTWQPKSLVRPIPFGEWRRKIAAELLKGVDGPKRDTINKVIDKFLNYHAENCIKLMSNWFQQGFSVLSLCENCSSTLMWSYYSDSHKGFVIEYDFSKLDYNDLRRRLCFPVFYTRKLRDATRYMSRTDMSDYNNLFGKFMCLIKMDEWAYEKEWRIVHALGQAHANAELPMPSPSAIILGSRVKPKNEEMMRELCRARAIPLKRMVQQPGSFDLKVADVSL